MIHKHLFYNN